ncbi:MAG: hypothetical protein V1863_07140 [Candidatus Omnitrophota bacterium]
MMSNNPVFARRFSQLSRWDFYSFVFFGFILVLQAANWFRMPIFVDCYYHLAAAQGFQEAGGWVGHAFWEYAPVGRPHLYPPFFQLLELIFLKMGVAPIFVARFFDFLIFPLFLFVAWFVTKKLFSDELAFLSLFLLNALYPLYLVLLSNTAFSLGLIFLLLSFLCLEQKKLVSSALYLGLVFYTHSLMSLFALLAIVFYGALNARIRKDAFKISFWALVSALPMLIHQMRYLEYVLFLKKLEFYFVQLNFLLYALALLGAFACFKKKGRYLFFVALTVSLMPLLVTHRDRFVSGQGLLPLGLLAAVYLLGLLEKLSKKGRGWTYLFWGAGVAVFYVATPLVVMSPLNKGPEVILDSSFANHVGMVEKSYSSKAGTIYYKKFAEEMTELVRDVSGPEDVFFCQPPYAGGLAFLTTPRATSNAMLSEVRPFEPFDEIAAARYILWFKDPTFEYPELLGQLVNRYGLKKITETEIAYLYLNEKVHGRKHVVPASVPFWACLVLMGAVLLALCLDRPGHKKS